MLKSGSSHMLKSVSSQALLAVAEGTKKSAKSGGISRAVSAVVSAAGGVVGGTALAAARTVYPEYLDPISANMINEDLDVTVNVHSMMFFEKPATLEGVKKEFLNLAVNFPRFRERVVRRKWAWPYWEPASFDIDEHVHEMTEPATWDTVEAFVSKEFSIGLDINLPLWKVFLFGNFTKANGDKGSVVIFKYSHTLADGYHIMRVMLSDVMERMMKEKPELMQTFISKTSDGQDRAKNSINLGKLMPALTKIVLLQDDKPSAIKAKELMTGTAPRVGRWRVSKATLDDIKPAVKKQGAEMTINDAFFGCLSSALTKYAEAKGQPLDDELTAVIWVALKNLNNLYVPQSVLPVEDMTNDTLGNIYLKLPKEKTSDKAVEAVNARISSLKGSPEPIIAKGLRAGFGIMPKGFSNAIWPTLSNKVSLSVSSLPGPDFEMEFCGTKLENVAFWVPPVGQISLFVTIITFNGKIGVSLSSDEAVLDGDDLSKLCEGICDEIDDYCKLSGQGSAPMSKL